jgi:eukaryotic-like serine/threonine-protein kinase
MTLAAGAKLGPYEILGQIGAGGMGEVWKAKDPRLGREVAVKVLPASFSADTDRLRRFEQEARAAGILNHPNITAVYDIGTHEGAPYVVQELLEGETLRSLLSGGRLPLRKTIDYSLQIAHGLSAAHEKGIVHRDLKPENLFVTRDGRVKILDFGLAKLTHQEEGSQATNLPTATAGTEPGVVLGTLGYMAPEQVRGKQADARSDIFSFGAILYEMLSGKRAFHGDSAADTMSAILREDPPDLSVTNQNISPGLERIVRHCLEKNPEQRFHSAHDVAFALEALTGTSGVTAAAPAAVEVRRRGLVPAALFAAAATLLALTFWSGRRSATGSASGSGNAGPVHQRLTFQRGNVLFARFTSDAQTVVYGASWGDRPAEIFLTRIGSPETRPLGIPNASLLSVSASGELAILLKKSNLYGVAGSGTLARVPLAGGAPRQILEDARTADWSPDGNSLAVVRKENGKDILEYPIGKRLAAANDIGNPRVSPDGRSVAAIESNADTFWIGVYGANGKKTELARIFPYIDSIAWHPSGNEVWLSDADAKGNPAIHAVTLDGKIRLVSPLTDPEVLHDIAKNGDVLVERELSTREIRFVAAGDRQDRDLSWLDQSNVACLTPDGRSMLFWESGQGGGPAGSVYLRSTDASPAARLGDGKAIDLSPDGRWALTLVSSGSGANRLVLLPTAAGEPKPVPVEGLEVGGGAFLPPDGKTLVLAAIEPGHGPRAYTLALTGGKPKAFTPDGLTNGAAISPDGKSLAANDAEGRATIYPVGGGEPKVLPGLDPQDVPIQWSNDGATLFVARFGELPMKLWRYSLAAGKKELWKEILPSDRSGLIRIESVAVARDGKSFAYSYNRVTASDLFRVTGWK